MQKYEIHKDWNSDMPEPATVHNELKLRNIVLKPRLYVRKVGEMIAAQLNSYIPFFALQCKQVISPNKIC
jgi:hypothetical protein